MRVSSSYLIFIPMDIIIFDVEILFALGNYFPKSLRATSMQRESGNQKFQCILSQN